jgi:hypothetical protein
MTEEKLKNLECTRRSIVRGAGVKRRRDQRECQRFFDIDSWLSICSLRHHVYYESAFHTFSTWKKYSNSSSVQVLEAKRRRGHDQEPDIQSQVPCGNGVENFQTTHFLNWYKRCFDDQSKVFTWKERGVGDTIKRHPITGSIFDIFRVETLL